MTVSELMEKLRSMPQNAIVGLHYDGGIRTEAEAVWLAQSGFVGVGPLSEPVYDDEDRVSGTHTEKENQYLTVKDMLLKANIKALGN